MNCTGERKATKTFLEEAIKVARTDYPIADKVHDIRVRVNVGVDYHFVAFGKP